jgi:hypothetical protein
MYMNYQLYRHIILSLLLAILLSSCAQEYDKSIVLDRTTSLFGTDTNSNGVRDDIDSYIDSKPDTAPQKQSLRMLSRAMTAAIVSTPTDTAAITNASNALNMAMACIWKNYPSDVANKMSKEMEKVTVNTKGRNEAYLQHSRLTSGSVIKAPREVVCE